jgi:hypothetical protein
MSKPTRLLKAENETIVALCPYTEIIDRKNNIVKKKDKISKDR